MSDYLSSILEEDNLPRPNTTPNEAKMSELDKVLLPKSPQEDPKGWGYRQYDRLAFQNAKPGDNIAQSMWKEISEAGSSFMSGLRRSRYNYAQAAQNSAEFIADKFGLDFDAKRDFLAASLNKWKNMRINPTTDEWEDQLFYLIGNLAPDAVGMVLGGGILGGAVSIGAKAAGFSKSASTIATVLGRITGDTAANVAQGMIHEAGQAELDGRDAEYAQAGKEAAAMGVLMSGIGRSAKALRLSRKSTALLTGSTLAGVTSLYVDGNDPSSGDTIAANAVLGGLFGLAVPGTSRVGSQDIRSWISYKKQSNTAPKDMTGWMKDYINEFLPETYDKVWVSEPQRESKLYTGSWANAQLLSPKDEFLLFLEQTSKKDLSGYNDNKIINVISDLEADPEMQLGQYKLITQPDPNKMGDPAQSREPGFEIMTGLDRKSALAHAKVLMDSINETNKVWLKDNPNYKSKVPQPAYDLPRYEARTNLKTKLNNKEKATGAIAKTAGGKLLKAHELSWTEYASIVGDTPANKQYHLSQIRRVAEEWTGEKKQSIPNKGALIEHDLWSSFGYIHSARRKIPTQPQGNTGRIIGETEKQKVIDNREAAYKGSEGVLARVTGDWSEKLVRWFADPAGHTMRDLEKLGHTNIRNAMQLQSLKKGKVEVKTREIEEILDFANMSKEEDAILTSYIFLASELDNVPKGLGADPPVPRKKVYRTNQINDALAYLREDADRLPGGWDKLKTKVEKVQDVFADMFEELRENGIIGEQTYNILKRYKYTPQKTLKEALSKYESHLLKKGKKGGDLDQTDSALHDLIADSDLKEKNTNLEALLVEHINKVYSMTAKNSLLSELAKVESPLWSLEQPKRIGGADALNFQRHEFTKDGTQIPIWIENKINHLLQERETRGLGTDLSTLARIASGVHPIQMTAVATNPFFAIFTHPLDLWSIVTHHRALPKFVPTVVKDMYVHNAETGAFPLFKNFIHAWKNDDVFKDYVKNDGTTSTIISSIQAEEMIRKSSSMMDQTKMTERAKRSWNSFIQWMGKFGHTMEVATRMTERDMLVKTGKFSKKEAAHESLRRLNYNRRGEAMHIIDTLIPFANAQAQILASQLKEVKTNPARVASTIAQLTLGIGVTRAIVEEHFPEYFKNIPWENRMRYWIVPTGAKEIDHKTGQEVQHYIKIKKAYNPFFMLANAAAELSMDYMYYGREGLPPIDTVEAFIDGVATATPVELRSLIPPSLKVLMAYTGNTDMSGRPVYRGQKVEDTEEINTELMGGTPTHNASIMIGNLLDMSPARLQAAADSYIAQNPLAWFVGSSLELPPEASTSAMTQMVKSVGIRKMIGTTNKNWHEFESGLKSQKKAGSLMYHEYSQKMLRPLSRFNNREINNRQFINEVRELMKDSKPHVLLKMLQIAKSEVKAKALMDNLLKKYDADEVYDYMQPYSFWHNTMKINDPSYRANHVYERYSDIDDPYWQKQFLRMVGFRGLFQDRFFAAEFRNLQRSN